jgi:hypothetical protein
MYVATSLSPSQPRQCQRGSWEGRSCDDYHSYVFLEMCTKSNSVSLLMYVASLPLSSHPCLRQQRPYEGGKATTDIKISFFWLNLSYLKLDNSARIQNFVVFECLLLLHLPLATPIGTDKGHEGGPNRISGIQFF